jgi:uncharacterized membrane protein YfcA
VIGTILIGIVAGLLTGLFGVGAGALIVPALVLFSGCRKSTQRRHRSWRWFPSRQLEHGARTATATSTGATRP